MRERLRPRPQDPSPSLCFLGGFQVLASICGWRRRLGPGRLWDLSLYLSTGEALPLGKPAHSSHSSLVSDTLGTKSTAHSAPCLLASVVASDLPSRFLPQGRCTCCPACPEHPGLALHMANISQSLSSHAIKSPLPGGHLARLAAPAPPVRGLRALLLTGPGSCGEGRSQEPQAGGQ